MASYSVKLIGFDSMAVDKFDAIFKMTQTRSVRYQRLPDHQQAPVHCVIVNQDADVEPALEKVLAQQPGCAVVSYSRNKTADQDSRPHIKGLLLASRVIKALDGVEMAKVSAQAALPVEKKVQTLAQDGCFQVLVVDDSEIMRKSLAIELANASQPIRVDFAEDGETALDRVRQGQYDFIFLDVMMPGIDGYETCTEIRKIEDMKKTPIIMLSAKTSPLDEVKGVMAGCTSYLTKPINKAEFQKMLVRIMDWLTDFQYPQRSKKKVGNL